MIKTKETIDFLSRCLLDFLDINTILEHNSRVPVGYESVILGVEGLHTFSQRCIQIFVQVVHTYI